MKQIRTEIIILKRLNYGEADRILTVITPDYGKVSLFAKGIRKSKSKLAGGLELFSVSNVTMIEGRGELKTITSARLKENFGNIVKNIDRTMVAYELLKITNKYTQQSCNGEYFRLLLHGLVGLQNQNIVPDVVYAWFVVRLLTEYGGAINLEKPGNAQHFLDNTKYSFSYDDMIFNSATKGEFNSKHIKLLRLAMTSEVPLIVMNVQGVDKLLEDLTPLIKQIMEFQL